MTKIAYTDNASEKSKEMHTENVQPAHVARFIEKYRPYLQNHMRSVAAGAVSSALLIGLLAFEASGFAPAQAAITGVHNHSAKIAVSSNKAHTTANADAAKKVSNQHNHSPERPANNPTNAAKNTTAGRPETAPAKSGTEAKPAPAQVSSGSYVDIAREAAAQDGISPNLFVRQIQQESGFNPHAASGVGAVGIAQFMPGTAAEMGIDPNDPVASLHAAAHWMARLSSQYGGDYAKALAAYNAGPGAVNSAVCAGGSNWLAQLPAETQNYVSSIMG